MSDVINYIDKQINKRTTTDIIRLIDNQKESLAETYMNLCGDNKKYMDICMLKNAPSYDLTIYFKINEYPNSARLILRKHIVKKLIDGEPFEDEIGYIDTYQIIDHVQRIPTMVYVEDNKIRFMFPNSIIPKDQRQKTVEFMSKIFNLFMSIFFVFNNPPQVKRVIEFAPKNVVAKENKESKRRTLKPIKVQRIITINEVGLERYVKTGGREFKRYMNVWGVIGHNRHYKNGRIVFIKPYEKGKDRNKGLLKPRERIVSNVGL